MKFIKGLTLTAALTLSFSVFAKSQEENDNVSAAVRLESVAY